MITPQKLKKQFITMLFAGLLFFITAFCISYSVKEYNTPSRVTSRLNSQIPKFLADLEKEIRFISSEEFHDKNQFQDFLNKNYKNAFSEKGIEILVYENDSLKYWTDNVFAAPVIIDSQNNFSDVVFSGSGYYLVKSKKSHRFTLVALQLLMYKYKYTNEYLPSGFYKRFSVSANAGIDLRQGKYPVKNADGKFLFSLTFEKSFELQLWLQYLIFAIYITSFLFVIAATFIGYMFFMGNFGQKWLIFLVFIIDIIILRAIQFYFRFPADLYKLDLFNPAYFASSDLLPSLGDFIINAVLGLQLTFFAFRHAFTQPEHLVKNKNSGKSLSIFFLLLIIGIYYFLTTTISSLILDSTISFRFENILSLPLISHLGLILITFLLLGFLFLFELAGRFYITWQGNRILYILTCISGIVVFSVFSYVNNDFDILLSLFLLLIFIVFYFQVKVKSMQKLHLSRIISLVIILSALATYIVNKADNIREHDKRHLLANHLADARDNLAEYYFYEAEKGIKSDEGLIDRLNASQSENSLNSITEYIKDNYFSGYWNKYVIQITVCQPDRKLNITPGNIITGCEDYFDEKINKFMRPVSIPGLFFLRQSVDAMYYLGKIQIGSNDSKRGNCKIFVEISSNDVWKGLGYPELLIDSKNTNVDNLYGYSYAFYYKGELVKNVGKFSFDIENRNIPLLKRNNGFYSYKGYNHLVHRADKDTLIVLSKEVAGISDLIAPFSYIVLLLIIILFFLNLMKGSALSWNIGLHTFRLRLQVIMISVIVLSSIVLVTVSLLFINNLNKNKNNEILSEKLHSVLVDLELKYGTIYTFDDIPQDELPDLLLNLSNTYFTDVNIYNTKGLLLASSRDQIFKEGMISEQINPSAAWQLMVNKESFLIQRENIGSYSFLSAYTPIRNMDNHLLGYLNLPYFARQEEIRREISGLISAYANIYIIMLITTVLLALLLSRFITNPLQRIGYQFSKVKMGDKNAKIVWTRKDEIGRLVDEYNRMIDEMEKSAELLARSERESAWRQMARQVAHEIKNPLTPIKLSMQLLMRAWNDQVPDWDARLKRFSQTLIMQIDTLSSIATEFSDFAQMPEPQIQQFDVIPLVQQSVTLFRDQSDCDITFETDQLECIIKADPNQILRVFNNLIKNALQAIPGDKQGIINITLSIVNGNCEICFKDNGTGIPNEKQTRIFSPNFTTKTAGMGLGLAMVKNIIDNTEGRIWFETSPGEGTTFFVSLPLKDPETTI
jgi:two-component system, NtrC family, nitrogen regulation sensor histidine kinase NtrY